MKQTDPEILLHQLEQQLQKIGPSAIAVSGGVDSMTLAIVACRVNPDSEVFHALSPAVPPQATERVRDWGSKESWFLHLFQAGEMEDPDYLANPVNRCYYCKTNLYDGIGRQTDLPMISGTNLDDLGDYRPGLIAAKENLVTHPYVQAGIRKEQVRAIARHLGLNDLHDLPAAPCLSSRVTTGISIDTTLLPLINAAEEQIWSLLDNKLKLEGVRCRIRPNQVAIELDTPHWDVYQSLCTDSNVDSSITDIVEDLFTGGGFPDQCQQVLIEPYERGSAFLHEKNRIDAKEIIVE